MPKPHFLSPLAMALLVALAGCEVRPVDPEPGQAVAEEPQSSFDAEAFVAENWDSRIMPAIQQDAVDLMTLLAELDEDAYAASMKYGYREGERPFNYKVTGKGLVTQVDTTSRAGVLSLDMGDGAPEVALQIGPVIRGTAMRDGLSFINFDQFDNQLEYDKVSNAMHAHLVESVLAELDLGDLYNQEISFVGALTLQDLESIMITPISIQVE